MKVTRDWTTHTHGNTNARELHCNEEIKATTDLMEALHVQQHVAKQSTSGELRADKFTNRNIHYILLTRRHIKH